MDVNVTTVATSRERRSFLQMPWKIYRNDPFWIPPLRMNQAELVGFKNHPFHDNARVQTFLAHRDGEVCGRIAAIINQGHIDAYQEKLGFVGFFESVDDQSVANALFDAAGDWLLDNGLEAMRGPVNPSLNYECALLVDGFDSSPMFMMTYNPPYYERLWTDYGFQKSQDLYAFWAHIDMLATIDQKLQFIIDEAKSRFGIKLRRMNRSRFLDDVRTFLDIYNKSLVGSWGFVPLSDGEVRHMAQSLRYLIVPEMTSIAEVDGRPVGAVFALLDYNPRVKAIDGRLFPTGFLQLLWRRQKIKKVRVLSANVLPEFQRWGVGLVTINYLMPSVHEWGIEEGEFSWVLESNHLSKATLERGGAKKTKTYRIYDYAFPA